MEKKRFAGARAPSCAGTPDELMCATNVTGEPVVLEGISGTDVITGQHHRPLRLPAFGYAWVRPE